MRWFRSMRNYQVTVTWGLEAIVFFLGLMIARIAISSFDLAAVGSLPCIWQLLPTARRFEHGHKKSDSSTRIMMGTYVQHQALHHHHKLPSHKLPSAVQAANAFSWTMGCASRTLWSTSARLDSCSPCFVCMRSQVA